MKFPVGWYIFIFPQLVHFYFPIDSYASNILKVRNTSDIQKQSARDLLDVWVEIWQDIDDRILPRARIGNGKNVPVFC